jgi:hypothetical protein
MDKIKKSSSALRTAVTIAARPCGKGNRVEEVSDALSGNARKETETGKIGRPEG